VEVGQGQEEGEEAPAEAGDLQGEESEGKLRKGEKRERERS
jgi:hypothetical protein